MKSASAEPAAEPLRNAREGPEFLRKHDSVSEQPAQFSALGHPIAGFQATVGNRGMRRILTSVGSPQSLSRQIPIHTLQQNLGNRALARLFQQTHPASAVPTLSQKCACGGNAKEECAECRKDRLALQGSSVGEVAAHEGEIEESPPIRSAEPEASRIAMRSAAVHPEPTITALSTATLQRQDAARGASTPAAQAVPGSGSPGAPAGASGSQSGCAPVSADAAAACSKSNPLVKDAATGKSVLWNGFLGQCAPQLSDDQQGIVAQVEKKRLEALNKAIKKIQAVQAAILTGELRPAPSSDVFFRATAYMNIFWSDAARNRYFDYFNNPEDGQRYDRLGKTADMLSRNLSFLVYPGRYVCASLGANVGAEGTPDGIVLPPGWFSKDAGYQLLTLTHEYFHVMINPLIDDYPAFRGGQICTFQEALGQPNCLSAFVAWLYTGRDEQLSTGGFQPCMPNQGGKP
jgi:hypothetical protein